LSQEAFSIISYDTNRQQKITGIPDEGKVSGVASLSPDGTLFAFVQDQSVVVGTLDISQAIFSPLTRIKKVAQSLLVTSQDELLLSDVTGVKAYKIAEY
jgi:hypothetical protein